MAAFTTGADWSFPDEIPGSWQSGQQQRGPRPNSPPTSDAPDDAPRQPPEPKTAESRSKPRRRHYPPRQCRICLDVVQPTFRYDTESPLPAAMQPAPRVTYESEEGGRLLSPCQCKGSQKYVHEECLGAWRRADPTQNRNYWQCPTCRYKYRLQRLTWSSWISSTASQLVLTLLIFFASIFLLGFVADPIINMYLDPVNTIATAGGPTGSLIYEDEPATWYEHMAKGLASLGLLGFAKFILTLSPFHWIRMGGGRTNVGGTGRDRMQQLSWITLAIGIVTFLYAVWRGVRAWSRKTLEQAGERVLDVPGTAEDDDDSEQGSRT
ncbi:ring finger domain-containing [Lecanosticta acicola]|uniref:Ring finger domain-containing n=1 Tax=Lecanosticta acicola TaxID=111012 RepID=A0AAI9EB60_9PEZI|nr:ring finger domain-containing [Lecanosticta acicola]